MDINDLQVGDLLAPTCAEARKSAILYLGLGEFTESWINGQKITAMQHFYWDFDLGRTFILSEYFLEINYRIIARIADAEW